MEVLMAANTAHAESYEAVIAMVRGWSVAQRFSLVQDVLATLSPELASNRHRQPTLARALGLLVTDKATPSDADITALLEERRKERYGL